MTDLATSLAGEGFAFARAGEMRGSLGALTDWHAFAASWNDLGLDTYMADGGRYRRRGCRVQSRLLGADPARAS